MLSPTWVFGVPAMAALATASVIFGVSLLHWLGWLAGTGPFGASWSVAAGFLFTSGHFALLMALATHFHGVSNGYRRIRPLIRRHAAILTLESMLIAGGGMILASLTGFVGIGIYWSSSGFVALPNILPLVLTAVLGATGAQTMFGGFLLAIIGGHRADFVASSVAGPTLPFDVHG